MDKTCDHTSVGVVIRDAQGRFLLLKRARFPVGIAPPAGHIDDHGSAEQAALDEVQEELGLTIKPEDLHWTAIRDRRIDNQCRRTDGTYHVWTVYKAETFTGQLKPSADETKGAAWYTSNQVKALIAGTKNYETGNVAEEDWEANPGMEPIWASFFAELGYLK